MVVDRRIEGLLRELAEARAALRVQPPPSLHIESASVTSSDMTREEMDAKLEAAEARTETRFVDLQHQIASLTNAITGERGVLAEMRALRADNAETRTLARQEGQFTRWTLFGIAVAIIGSFIAIVAYGGDQLGAGREIGGALANLEAKVDKLQKPVEPPRAAPKT